MELQASTKIIAVGNLEESGIACGELSYSSSSIALDDVRQVMLERVALDDEYFNRLRQRDEPDMSLESRIEICGKLLDSNPGEFLARFESQICDCDLIFFEQFTSDYVVGFRVAEIKRKRSRKNGSLVRNRRFEAMQRLEGHSLYFSDEEMKKRDPLLYEEMIGQFLTEDETNSMAQNQASSDVQLSHLLLQHLQVIQNNELYQEQIEKQNSQMEEEEEEEASDEDEETTMPTGSEKLALRKEFVDTMRQRFLDGKDVEFDYSNIDNNPEYDSVDQLNRDAEEKYFGEDQDEDF